MIVSSYTVSLTFLVKVHNVDELPSIDDKKDSFAVKDPSTDQPVAVGYRNGLDIEIFKVKDFPEALEHYVDSVVMALKHTSIR